MIFRGKYDNSEVDRQLKEEEAKSKRITAQMVSNIRKASELGIALFQAFGGVIDQTYALGIQAGLRTLELIATTQAALAAGTLGVTALITAGAQAAAIALMLKAIADLQAGRQEAAQTSLAFARVGQLATWR
jgi:hypothetical protein